MIKCDYDDPRNVADVRQRLCADCDRTEICDDNRMRQYVKWNGTRFSCNTRLILQDQRGPKKKRGVF